MMMMMMMTMWKKKKQKKRKKKKRKGTRQNTLIGPASFACMSSICISLSQRRKETFRMILTSETSFDGSGAIVDDHRLVDEDVLRDKLNEYS